MILSNILHSFEQEVEENDKSSKVVEETLLPFMLQSINYICIYLELFNSQQEFVKTFSDMIKTAIKICGIRLENAYEKILYSILKVFEKDPYQNMSLLSTVATLIELFGNSARQREWLFANFAQFNAYLFQALGNNYEQSSDLLFKWVDIQIVVLRTYREFFLTLKDLGPIIDLILRAFYDFSNVKLLRKLNSFINTLVGNKQTVQSNIIMSILPGIIGFALIKLPELDSERIRLVVPNISKILIDLDRKNSCLSIMRLGGSRSENYRTVLYNIKY